MSFTSCNKGALGGMDKTYLPSFERLATFLLLKCLHSEPNGPELRWGSRFLNHYVSEIMLFFIQAKAYGDIFSSLSFTLALQILSVTSSLPTLQETCVLFISFYTAKSLISI